MEGEEAIMALPVGGEACSSSSSNRRRGGGAKCGRWNPTAEQVKVLMGLFRSGLRTPSTEQIQSITGHLSCYGKIESKNVFYWFQNHKARERHHKRRRRPATQSDPSLMQLAPAKRLPMGAGGAAATNGRTVQVPWEAQEERKMMQTLELFPLKSSSCRDMQMDKMRMNMGWKDMTFLDAGRELRLNLR